MGENHGHEGLNVSMCGSTPLGWMRRQEGERPSCRRIITVKLGLGSLDSSMQATVQALQASGVEVKSVTHCLGQAEKGLIPSTLV